MYELIKSIVENPKTKENPEMLTALAELMDHCPKFYFELMDDADKATKIVKANGTLQKVLGRD